MERIGRKWRTYAFVDMRTSRRCTFIIDVGQLKDLFVRIGYILEKDSHDIYLGNYLISHTGKRHYGEASQKGTYISLTPDYPMPLIVEPDETVRYFPFLVLQLRTMRRKHNKIHHIEIIVHDR